MPKRGLNIVALPQKAFATGREERPGLTELRARLTPATIWSLRLTPILTLLQEVLADLFKVRDQALQAQRHGGKPAQAVLRQYATDLQWLNSPEEEAPFSFGWVCQVLGLEASAVRRRYLSGQPVSLPQRHRASITLGHLKLESVLRRAGKARAPRHTATLNGRGHEGNGTEPAPQ
jgi:hypothetical protein